MDSTSPNQLILRYVEGWIAGNREQVLSTLDPACLIIESYGPTYRGKEMVGRWIDSWFAPGNRVNRWEVTSFYTGDEACFFEWIFECTYEGSRSSFEGASLARLSQGKITFLREYAMTASRYEWEG
jgi:SnoaL-like domain